MNTFGIPSVDHLIEGVHYTIVDWSFAEGRARDRGLETNMPSRGVASTFTEKARLKSGKKVSWVMKDGKPTLVESNSKPEIEQLRGGARVPKPQQTMGGIPLPGSREEKKRGPLPG
jgi:hypothetical protein